MLIISGKAYVAADKRVEYVAAFTDFIAHVRATQPTCLDFYIAADPLEPGRINIFERWNSEAELRAFQAVARPPRTGIGVLEDDEVLKYEISSWGPVFPG